MVDGNRGVKCYLRMFAAFLACQIRLSCSILPLCFLPFTCDHGYFLASDQPKWLSHASFLPASLTIAPLSLSSAYKRVSLRHFPVSTSCRHKLFSVINLEVFLSSEDVFLSSEDVFLSSSNPKELGLFFCYHDWWFSVLLIYLMHVILCYAIHFMCNMSQLHKKLSDLVLPLCFRFKSGRFFLHVLRWFVILFSRNFKWESK